MPFSRGFSQTRDGTLVSYASALAGGFFIISATREAPCVYVCVCACVACVYIYVYSFPDFFPYRLLQYTEYSSLCYTIGSCWLSILYIV